MMPNTPGTLLIVDDETDLIEILMELLAPHKFKIHAAPNGLVALELFKAYPEIDAVLSDLNMPLMDGMKLLHAIREINTEVPFVFLSAYGDKDKLQEALRLGATDFLDKPVDTKKLPEIIGKAVKLGKVLKNISADIEKLNKENLIIVERLKELQIIRKSLIATFFQYRKLDLEQKE